MERNLSASQHGYRQPFSWWGYRETPNDPLSITRLIQRGTLNSEVAAFLWIALEQRSSLFVAATPPEAGKTAVLTALLAFLPPDVDLVYLRGWYERFGFLDEDHDPTASYLLSNEISPHLPTYLWGRGVRRLFDAATSGYGMAATVHADRASEVLDLLSGYPLEVPPDQLRHIDLVLTLSYRRYKETELRRVMRLELIEDAGGSPKPTMLAEREVILGDLKVSPGRLINALVRHYEIEREYATSEFANRVSYLDRLVARSIFGASDVQRALREYIDRR